MSKRSQWLCYVCVKEFPISYYIKIFHIESVLNRGLIIKSEFPYKAIIEFNQIGSLIN